MTAVITIGLVYNYVKDVKSDKFLTHVATIPNKLDCQDTNPNRKVSWSETIVKSFSVVCRQFDKTCSQPFGTKQIYKYRDSCNTIDDDYDIDCCISACDTLHRFGDSKTTKKELICFEFPKELCSSAELTGNVSRVNLTFQYSDPNRVNSDIIKSFVCRAVSHEGDRSYLSLKDYCDDGHITLGFIQTRKNSTHNELESVCIDPNLFLMNEPQFYFYNLDEEQSDDDDF